MPWTRPPDELTQHPAQQVQPHRTMSSEEDERLAEALRETGHDSLVDAADLGDIDAVMVLVGAGADFGEVDEYGFTAALAAAANGHYDVLEFLVENGADLDQEGGEGFSPLMAAAQDGQLEAVSCAPSLSPRATHSPPAPPRPGRDSRVPRS